MGSKFLKVTGILMIIFGAIALVTSIIAMLGLGVLEALGLPMGLIWASGIIALVGSVAEFVAGIIGVRIGTSLKKPIPVLAGVLSLRLCA